MPKGKTMTDKAKLEKASQHIYIQMMPRMIALASAIRNLSRDLFPNDTRSQQASNMAATDMAIGSIIFEMVKHDDAFLHAEVEAKFSEGIAATYEFIRNNKQ